MKHRVVSEFARAGQVVWRRWLTAHARAVAAIEGELSAAGVLPLERYDLLLALSESPGRRSRLTDLADAMLFTRGGITRLVARLVEDGLVRLAGSPDDARVKLAELTPKGVKAMERTWRVYRAAIEKHFIASLDPASLEGLERAMGLLLTPRAALTVEGREIVGR